MTPWPGYRVAALVLALSLPLPAAAHQLTVFARVEDGTILITANFADGSAVKAGTLRLRNAGDLVVLEQALDGTSPIRIPVDAHRDGVTIEVDAGNGHANYWVLTPADMATAEN